MITDKQREERSKGLGSSDIPTILGLNRWQSQTDLWLRRTGQAAPLETNEAMRLGQVLEPTLLQLAGERIGARVVRPSSTFVGSKPHFRANIDGMVGEAKRGADLVEIKTTGMADEWGADGTDEIPLSVRVQVLYQMACASSSAGWVGCLIGSHGLTFRMYRVQFDSELAEYVMDRANAWWEKHIVGGERPEDAASIDVLKSVERTQASIALPISLFEEEEAARLVLENAERSHKVAKSRLVSALGTASRGTSGPYTVSVNDVQVERFDKKAFEAEHADLASRFTVPSGYKRIDIRKRKD